MEIDNPEEEKVDADVIKDEFMNLLLNGPVLSEEEIAIILENRESINVWRKENPYQP